MNGESSARLWGAFLFEIDKATVSLMFLLQAMEMLRNSGTLPRVGFPAKGVTQYFGELPRLSLFGVSPNFTGMDFNRLLERESEAEQLAFKGWIVQVYNAAWESQYRNAIKETFEVDGVIRPKVDVIGDLRRIRNDVVHNAIASEEETGKCKVLRWFKPGEPMILGMRHVFDFLNQLGLMSTSLVLGTTDATFRWEPISSEDTNADGEPCPKLVSVRTATERESEDGELAYQISLVFEDGMFIQLKADMSDLSSPGASDQECIAIFSQAMIDENGDLKFPTQTYPGDFCYRWARDSERVRGPGMWGPPMQFREG